MRIVHVQTTLGMGGSETVILQLAREQRRLGHDASICCLFGEGPFDARAAEYGIPVTHLHTKRKRLAMIRSLYRYLGTERFDVVNSHWGVWLASAVAGFLRGVPRIHTHHSNQPRRLFPEHRVASFFTTKVVILTPYIEPYIAKWVGVPRRKLVVIPNGLDPEHLLTAKRVEIEGIPPEAPVVGMVARLSPPKDLSTFLRAAKRVEAVRPDVWCVSVGDGAQREQFHTEAAALGVTRFRFLGNRPDVPSLLRRMTLHVLATRHEGHPISVVEALISGVPCLASDIPSIRYTLDGGRAGRLVPGGNPEALAEAILDLLAHPEQAAALAAHGQRYAEQFSARTMAESYLALYERCLKPA